VPGVTVTWGWITPALSLALTLRVPVGVKLGLIWTSKAMLLFCAA
jgi:hypothetical protein